MQVEPSIFKAYDIRGIYPEQLNEDTAYALGRAYATHFNMVGKKVAVGSDTRLSSPSLKEKVIAGLLDSGVDVDDLGLVSTPTFYFATSFYGYDGGLQVSASHNPKQWNGLKIVGKNAYPVSKNTGLLDIKKIIETESYIPKSSRKGTLQKKDSVISAAIEEQIKSVDVTSLKPLKIVIDGANGMGAIDMAELFKALSDRGVAFEVIPMNFTPDGNFPAHEADPMKAENIQPLCERVVTEKADLGIAPDGDGDRYFFVDEKGEVLPQGILRGMMAGIELKEHPGALVAYDIRPGRITRDMIEELGGKAIVTPVGHSLIKEVMIKEGAIFGGESSGHYFYKFPYGTFEAPIVLVLKLLRFISEQNKPLSEISKPFKRYFHSGEINIAIKDHEAATQKIEAIKEMYKDGKQSFVDGISVEYPEFWFNLRASNTEPLIRLTLEATTEEIMKSKVGEITNKLVD